MIRVAVLFIVAGILAWLVRNRPERDPETYPVQPIDPWLMSLRSTERQAAIDLERIRRGTPTRGAPYIVANGASRN